jgi:D-alanyl-lipoteichoic acid acyltransferase DltB (MBOAT superfamily)
MLFNSLEFALFLPIVFTLYWFVTNRNLRSQNLLLLISSYFFYGCWDFRFLFLLVFSTLLDYYSGLKIQRAENKQVKKAWFWASIIINLGFLGVFKYYNFFVSSFAAGLSSLGVESDFQLLSVILPVGISFYTFHGLSYVIDVYKERIRPVESFVDYSVFVSFFPLLVAGPIERATHLLPQIQKKRVFDYAKASDGLKQILWGLVKKVVIADNCAEYVNMIFNNSDDYQGSTLLVGAVLFAFQIYCDFSGYSDIALGTARLFGIELLRNFAFPYFSRDIAEFWRRWHISLSSWFRDYLYIPLGGSKGGIYSKVRNTFIIFIVSGFWHGANWTFIMWGLLNAIFIMPSIFFNTNRNNIEIVAKGKILPSLKEFLSIMITFAMAVFAWIFFRAEDLPHAFAFISEMFSSSFFGAPDIFPKKLFLMIFIFMMIEWIGREDQHGLATFGSKWPPLIRYAFYYFLIIVFALMGGDEQQFIYFQF